MGGNEIDAIFPEYLNEEFFRNILKNNLSDETVKINNLSLSMGTTGGDNYCSFIYRAKISYNTAGSMQPKNKSFIIKSIPIDGARAVFASMDIYEKESNMYLEIIPKIDDILSGDKIGPKCYYSTPNPIKTIVMEDLNESGYTIRDRIEGFDETHAGLVLKRMGQFHAGSLILVEKDPNILTAMYSKGLFNSISLTGGLFYSMFKGSFTQVVELTKQWSGFENIAKKLHNLEDQFLTRTIQTIRSESGSLQVLNHGDFWVNNVLFKYNDPDQNNPTSIRIIDFQACLYGSPGLDINYFLYTSLPLDILIHRRDFLIQNHYYKAFRDELEKANFKNIPSLREILNEIREKEFFRFFTTISVSPYFFMERDACTENSMENFANEEISRKIREVAVSSQRLQDMLKYLLKRWDEMGILD